MSVNKFADFNGKSDKGKTPLTVPRCADNRQLFEGTVGKEVSYAEAEPGDIICYPGHVAIYIGNGKIVHASSPSTGIGCPSGEPTPMVKILTPSSAACFAAATGSSS